MALSRGGRCMILIVLFLSIALIAYMLRVYTRFVMMRNAGPEDFCLGLAVMFSVGVVVLIGEQVKYGLGEHIWTLDEETIFKSLKPFWASVWVYTLSLSFLKVSMLLQYLRIFPMRNFRIICWTVLGMVTLCGLWSFFGSVFICYPIAYFWDHSIKGGKCLNRYGVWFSTAGLNILTDFTLIILPMPVLQRMALPKRQKRALMFVFALGGFGCIVSILRLHSLVAISKSKDPTWDNPSPATWSSIESSVGITCASLTALKPLLSRFCPRLLSNTGVSRYYRRAGYHRSDSHSVFPAPAFKGFQKLSITKSRSSIGRSANEDSGIRDASELLRLGHDVNVSAGRGSVGCKADEDKRIKADTVVQQAVKEHVRLQLLQQVHLC